MRVKNGVNELVRYLFNLNFHKKETNVKRYLEVDVVFSELIKVSY